MFKPLKLDNIKSSSEKEINEILKIALVRDLTLNEIRMLLFSKPEYWKKIIKTADKVKEQFFGKKIYFYVPIYFDSFCINDCLYCEYRKSNSKILRKRLNFEEFKKEIGYLDKQGYSKIELVSSTDPSFPIETAVNFIKYVKSLGKDWCLMNNRPLKLEEYKRLKKAGLDWSWLWMEGYNENYYKKYHPEGTEKSDFKVRLKSYDNMGKAGLNIGTAFLMGLSPDWQFEIYNTIAHGKYLKEKYNIEIQFGTPRFCPAKNVSVSKAPYPEAMTDDKFRLMIALYRLAIRDCWINCSTRETIDFLEKLWEGGGNLTNPESQTVPGGYSLGTKGEQFEHYSYSVDLFISRIKKLGLEPIN